MAGKSRGTTPILRLGIRALYWAHWSRAAHEYCDQKPFRLDDGAPQPARRHEQRTPDDEARVILEEALAPSQKTPVGIEAVAAEIRKLGLRTPSESVQIIREDRDR